MTVMNGDERAEGYDESTYGDAFADVYDEWYGEVSDKDATVALIAELAAERQVLELGVGTGRLALPLAELGVHMTGLDASSAMLDRLSRNDPGGTVTPQLGDMAELKFVDLFGVVFVAFNTLFNLASTAAQQRCFDGVAGALLPSGYFIVETIVPAEPHVGDDRGITPRLLDDGGVVLNVTMTDRNAKLVTGQHVEISKEGLVTLRPWQIHYCSVVELDEMATGAGLFVDQRWEDWSRTPFSVDSSRHVTIYQLR